MLTSCRVQLLTPRPQEPGRQYLLEVLSANIQSAINEANLTGRAWATSSVILQVTPGTDEYILQGQNVGRILDATTYDPTNPVWIERQVEFFEFSEMTENWGMIRDSASMVFTQDGGPHTAMRMTFYRKSGLPTVYVRVLPIPQQVAEYRIAFNIQTFGGPDTALDIEPILANHHHFWVAATCRDALPACQWSDDKAVDQQTRANLKTSFDTRVANYAPQFKKDIGNISMPRDNERLAAFSIDA